MSAYPGLRERAAAIVERRRVEVAAGLPAVWSARRGRHGADWLTRARPASGLEFDGARAVCESWAFPALPRVAVLAVWWGSGCAPVPEASRLGLFGLWEVSSFEVVSYAATRAPRVGGGAVWLRSGVLVAWGAHPRDTAPRMLDELRGLSAHVGAYGWGDVVEVDTTD